MITTWAISTTVIVSSIVSALAQQNDNAVFVNKPMCGLSSVNTRIINGLRATDSRFPWIVHLKIYLNSGKAHTICAGSFITEYHVITAGHCMRMTGNEPFKIVAHYGHVEFEKGTPVNILRYYLHEDFHLRDFRNDIAILLLPEPVSFSKNIKPICLPIPRFSPYGMTGIVAGWGTVNRPAVTVKASGSKELFYTTLHILNEEQCKASDIFKRNYVAVEQVCAYANDTDACQGDSGGPLTVQYGGRNVLVGLVSYGYDCAMPGVPSAFTHVVNYIDWILKVLGKSPSRYQLVVGAKNQ